MAKHFILAVDVGSTFTDFCLLNEETGELKTFKILSSPEDPTRAITRGLELINQEAGASPEKIALVFLSTTIATNMLLEKNSFPIALVTTRGFKDVLHIGRQERPHPYNFKAKKNSPFVPRQYIFEIDERLGPAGEVIRPLSRANAKQVLEKIKQAGVDSLAVCFLHAYANPLHEREFAALAKEALPGLPVTISSDIIPEPGEYERTSTTVINAVLQPIVQKCLSRLDNYLRENSFSGGLFVMQSNGRMGTAAQARQQSARTVYSGPAAGVLTGKFVSRFTGRRNLITADMGGTSTDMCLLVGGEPCSIEEGSVGGHPLRFSMLDIHTFAAGGGSIAWVDNGGALKVGPASAGAAPGPACYGKGGSYPTVTDANVVLGRLSVDSFPASWDPDPDASWRVIEQKIARPLGMDTEAAAEGIIKIVNSGLTKFMRLASLHGGYDPRDFTLLACGGAGPLHAVELAGELGITQVLVSPSPAVASAAGMLSADTGGDYVRAFAADLARVDPEHVNREFAAMEEEARRELARQGDHNAEITFTKLADLRYSGQLYKIKLQVPAGRLIAPDLQLLRQSFHQAHDRLYGFTLKDVPVELVALKLVARGRRPEYIPRTPCKPKGDRQIPSPLYTRPVIFNGRRLDTPVFTRGKITAGTTLSGPAVIEQAGSTTLIWPGNTATCDSWGNLIIELGVH